MSAALTVLGVLVIALGVSLVAGAATLRAMTWAALTVLTGWALIAAAMVLP